MKSALELALPHVEHGRAPEPAPPRLERGRTFELAPLHFERMPVLEPAPGAISSAGSRSGKTGGT